MIVFIKLYVDLLKYHQLTCFYILPTLKVYYNYNHTAKSSCKNKTKILYLTWLVVAPLNITILSIFVIKIFCEKISIRMY